MESINLIVCGISIVSFLVILLVIGIVLSIMLTGTQRKPTNFRYEDEKYYLNISVDPPRKMQFPSLDDDFSVYLTVVIPAYNEEFRLPTMLEECAHYLESRRETEKDFTYEVIIVDDGSSDNTTKVGLEHVKRFGSDKVRVLTLVKNRGKGGATKFGMLSARGRYLLFADADGATKFAEVEKLEKELKESEHKNGNSIAIGSRAHLEKESIASRSFFRTVLMWGFHFLVWLFAVRSVRDTQCGFKMFTRSSAQMLFPNLHVERWAFDVELLHVAERRGVALREVAVTWSEVDGSKLVPFWSWLQMGKDLILIWLKYTLGVWDYGTHQKSS